MDPSVSSTTRIPYDILISIIDALALFNQFEDLSAWSQTCRMLLQPCRVHLFSTITIGKNAPQFVALLDKNPTIQFYIQELIFEPALAVLSKDLANAFLSLSNLKTLVLQGRRARGGDFSWIKLTPDIQDALFHLFGSPSVTRIMIESFIDTPTILISKCSNLKHLYISRYVSFTSRVYNTTFLASPKLASLDFSKAQAPTVENFLNGRRADGFPLLDLSGLQSLSIPVKSGTAAGIHLTQILRSALKLEHLCLYVYQAPFIPGGLAETTLIPDNLVQVLARPLPSLRSFKIEWNVKDNGISEIYPGLTEALQALAHQPNNINEFNLISMIPSPWSHTFAAPDWEMIDRVLADRFAFRRLKKLSIRFWTELDVSSEAEEKKIQDQLMEFKATKFPRLLLASDDYLDFQLAFDNVKFYESKWTTFSLRLEEHHDIR